MSRRDEGKALGEASGPEIPAVLIAGGQPRDPAYMSGLIARALEGRHKPLAAYIGTANGDHPDFFARMASILTEAGVGDCLHVRLAEEAPDLDAARDTLARADMVFLAGGEVEDGMYWLDRHGLSDFLRELYRTGKLFVGVSAGTIMMGSHWLRWEDPGDDGSASLFDCLGFVPVLFDVHGEDEDWAELKLALRQMGDGAFGFALPGGSMIYGDSSGSLVDIVKQRIVFVNVGGEVRVEAARHE